jgi:curved DNA-binding protein CbpA
MQKIIDSRKLLGLSKDSDLKEIKSTYRSLMKEFHPDTFQGTGEEKLALEEKSKQVIEAYHLLVSVAPETQEQGRAQYTETVLASAIEDYSYRKQTLLIKFDDGSSYEYFEVPKSIYTKLVNSDSPARFSRRHIYHSYVYRKVTKAMED